MVSNWEKFKLLLQKNWIIAKRNKFQTFLEIFIPVAFCSLLVLIRTLVAVKRFDHSIHYKGLPLDHLKDLE